MSKSKRESAGFTEFFRRNSGGDLWIRSRTYYGKSGTIKTRIVWMSKGALGLLGIPQRVWASHSGRDILVFKDEGGARVNYGSNGFAIAELSRRIADLGHEDKKIYGDYRKDLGGIVFSIPEERAPEVSDTSANHDLFSPPSPAEPPAATVSVEDLMRIRAEFREKYATISTAVKEIEGMAKRS